MEKKQMTAILNRRPVEGERVGVDDPKYPGVWTVKSLGPKNAALTPENGGRGLRAPYSMLTEPPTAVVSVVPVMTLYDPGELVRIDNDARYAGLWVVIADKGGDRVNLARVGGDDGRYVRYPRHRLVLVDPKEVLKESATKEGMERTNDDTE